MFRMAPDRAANYHRDMTEFERHLLRVGIVRTAIFVSAFVGFLALAAAFA